MTLNLPAPGNGCGEMNLQAQPEPENRSEVRTSKSEGQRWNGSPQYANLRQSIPRENPQELAEKVERRRESTNYWYRSVEDHVFIWGLFVSTTMEAAIHLGPNYVEILELYRNTDFEQLQNLFDITQKLTLDHQAKILNLTKIVGTSPSWTRSTLSHDQVITWTKAKVRVHSDSVLCLEKMSEANRRWENQEQNQQSNSYRELQGIAGEPIEFEWNIFPGLTSLEILQKIQKDLQDRNIEPEKFEDRIIFMSMFKDIEWTKRIQRNVFRIPNESRITRRDSRKDTGHSSALETTRIGVELSVFRLREHEILPPHRWWNDSKKPVIQYSRASVL